MKISKNLLLFYSSRILGLGLKPVALWCALNFGTESWSQFFAKLFFVVPATFIAFNIDGHIEYYKNRFGVDARGLRAGLSFRTYVSHLVSHLAIFSVPLFLGFLFYFGNTFLALSFLIYAVHEKMFDEILRFQLFAKRYDLWAICFFLKAALPITALAVSLLTRFPYPSVTLVVLTVVVSVTVLVGVTSRGTRRFLLRALANIFTGKTIAYLKSYRSRYVVNQLAALCAYNLLAVDKWIGSTRWNGRLLAEVVLATQFGSVYLVLIDNIFFTVNRDRYVKQGARPGQVIHWMGLFVLSAMVMAAYGIVLTFLKTPLGFQSLPVPVILAIFLVSVLKGFSRPLEEYAFWHHSRRAALLIDASCIALMYAGGRFFFSLTNVMALYLVVIVVMMVRVLLYLALTNQDSHRTFLLRVKTAG